MEEGWSVEGGGGVELVTPGMAGHVRGGTKTHKGCQQGDDVIVGEVSLWLELIDHTICKYH